MKILTPECCYRDRVREGMQDDLQGAYLAQWHDGDVQ